MVASGIGQVISKLHQRQLPDSLLDFIKCEFSFDHALILAFHENAKPTTLHKSYSADQAESALPEYLQTAYMMDPVYGAHLAGLGTGFYRLRDIAPDRFHNTAYYKNYYSKTGYTDEVLFFAPTKTGYNIALSLFRQNDKSPNFTKPALTKLRSMSPIICSLLQQHWNNFSNADSDTPGITTDPLSLRIKMAIREVENVELTDRQAEIVAFTLRGHSATSISLAINISAETVKVHRRNIYARLRISSQSQLFSMVTKATGPLIN